MPHVPEMDLNLQTKCRSTSVWFMAAGRVHHSGCVYEVSLAYIHWCLRNGAKSTDLTLESKAQLKHCSAKCKK